MSVLPKGWEQTSLLNLVVVNYGKALPEQARNAEGSFPVFGSSGAVGKHDAAITAGPSVIVGRKGAAGAVHLVDRPCWPIDTAYFIEPPAGLSVRWLYYFLGSQQLVRLDKSTAIPSLSRDDLYNELVPVAPELEQGRVLEKLEELLSDLDAGEAELKAAQKKLTQYRQSLLKAAVEGALTASWREQQRAQHPPAESGAQLLQRILTERRARWEAKQLAKFEAQGKAPPKDWQKKYPEPVQPDTTDLPALPQGWVWATIDQLAAVGTGVTPLRSKSQYFDGGTVPWVTSGALNEEMVTAASEMLTPLALQECRLDVYPAGALLVAMYGEGKTRGKCAELGLPATINQAIAALVLEGSALDCKNYLKMFLLKSYDDMRKQASGGVQPNLNLQIVRSIFLPLPPANEQEALVDALKAQLDSIQEQQGMVTKMLKQSTAQRQNILRAAFYGQLVPQDPSDEPAADLLARIRAERAAQAPARKPRGRRAQEAA